MVDVPVEDRHPLDAEHFLRVAGGDRGVVEEAETHRPVGGGVVAGRPDQREQAVGAVAAQTCSTARIAAPEARIATS